VFHVAAVSLARRCPAVRSLTQCVDQPCPACQLAGPVSTQPEGQRCALQVCDVGTLQDTTHTHVSQSAHSCTQAQTACMCLYLRSCDVDRMLAAARTADGLCVAFCYPPALTL
jgi:hypothetical protein